MTLAIKHFNAKFKKELNPKVGLIALSTDQTIEGDFNNICKNLPLDIFIIVSIIKIHLQGKIY